MGVERTTPVTGSVVNPPTALWKNEITPLVGPAFGGGLKRTDTAADCAGSRFKADGVTLKTSGWPVEMSTYSGALPVLVTLMTRLESKP